MEDGTPIYLQILLFIKRGIIAGTVVNGDELPSRRVLSALLGVNPNTVQKAYRLLEEDGLKTAQAWAEMYFAGKKLGTWQEQKAELEQLITADALLAIIQKCFE